MKRLIPVTMFRDKKKGRFLNPELVIKLTGSSQKLFKLQRKTGLQ